MFREKQTMKKRYNFMLMTLAVFALMSCNQASENPQMENPAKHVIMIGFDGMSANSIKNGVDMPTFRQLMAEGASTVKNRSILPSSSACNWASMYMGAGPELHGFNTWGSQKPDLPSRELTENGLFPDIFYQIRQINPKAEISHFYEWGGMKFLADAKSMNLTKQVSLSGANTTESVASVVEYIKTKKPNFCAIAFGEPDGAGHGKGWESKEYFQTLNHVDKALKEIVEAVEAAGIMDETIFVLTSDHGGKGTGHGGPTMDEMETALVFCGKGIKKGIEIPESTMIFDVASTIGYMFGIDQPQVWIGRPILSIFE